MKEARMSTGTIGVVIVIIVVVAIVAIGVGPTVRRRRLKKRFGPEYERVVAECPSRRLAEVELAERERRVQKLQLRDLSQAARDKYGAQWADVQEGFVYAPAEATADAQRLVDSVMRDRGYPVSDYDHTVDDLSVQHARTLDHFRSAHEISARAASGQATTEEQRIAMLYYRDLFIELLGAKSIQTRSRQPWPARPPRRRQPADGAAALGRRRRIA
jgi:hypothetical protein